MTDYTWQPIPGKTLEIINLKTGTLGGKIYYSQFLKEETSSAAE